MNFDFKTTTLAFILFLLLGLVPSEGSDKNDNPDEKWKKKDPRDYTDADLERLLDQWEVSSPMSSNYFN